MGKQIPRVSTCNHGSGTTPKIKKSTYVIPCMDILLCHSWRIMVVTLLLWNVDVFISVCVMKGLPNRSNRTPKGPSVRSPFACAARLPQSSLRWGGSLAVVYVSVMSCYEVVAPKIQTCFMTKCFFFLWCNLGLFSGASLVVSSDVWFKISNIVVSIFAIELSTCSRPRDAFKKQLAA